MYGRYRQRSNACWKKVKCSFQPEKQKLWYARNRIELVFAESENLDYAMLKKFVSAEELDRSARFQSNDDRRTYVCCHAILRLMLAHRLNKAPFSLVFESGYHNKPYIQGNPVYFNISHTNKAFAIAISDTYTGVDIENRNRVINPGLIMDSTFSLAEQSFINENSNEENERLLILWTRKEALLKALGRGIIKDLTQIEVSGAHNIIPAGAVPLHQDISVSGEHFIYSICVSDHFLSVASPNEADLELTVINESNYLRMLTGLLNRNNKTAIAG